jgi:hypothetical protein
MTEDFVEVDEHGNPVIRPSKSPEDELRSRTKQLDMAYQALSSQRERIEHALNML